MTFEEYVEWLNAQSVVEPDIVTWSEDNRPPQPDPTPTPNPSDPVPQEDTPMEE
jgi:hypothetical protein